VFFFAEQQCGPEIAASHKQKYSFGWQQQSDEVAAKNGSASVFCKVERDKREVKETSDGAKRFKMLFAHDGKVLVQESEGS